jgi:uncharacterized membrane protein YidH (DUF202 family)
MFLGMWCFLYQEEAASWILIKFYRNAEQLKENAEQKTLKVMLSLAGTLAILVSIISFQAVVKSVKIAWTHNTLHTILMVKGLALTLFGTVLVVTCKMMEPFYELPGVEKIIPAFTITSV